MRLAVFTPLNPARSGIADYSEALLPHLSRLLEIEVFIGDYEPSGWAAGAGIPVRHHREFRPEDFDAALYHIGNNPYHTYIYDAAIQHPGIVVLHEFNLHHLLADVTIRRNDWDAYMSEVERSGGKTALDFAQRVRSLEVGPDYDGVPMNRTLIERSGALIVHSRFMVNEVLAAKSDAAVKQIPHGAWIPEVDRNAARNRLGVDETTPLIGIFGFLKPYKRIAQALRAMQRLVKLDPRARMILVGEEHADLPLKRLLSQLQLEDHVRLLGYVPVEDLAELIGAVDICLNLRYPTAGETSGTLLRALGLGRAVIVSDVGSFSELPDDICLKAPVDASEVEVLTDYLSLLCSRPEFAHAMGARARYHVAETCAWDRAARQYADWVRAYVEGRASAEGERVAAAPPQTSEAEPAITASAAAAEPARDERHTHPSFAANGMAGDAASLVLKEDESPLARYILGFCHDSKGREDYVRTHLTRLIRTLEMTPQGTAADRVLEMGAYMHMTPALKTKRGYGEVWGSYLGPAGRVDQSRVVSESGEVFECRLDLFNAEKDPYPYPDEHFSTVLCCELLEHLEGDPMHMMAEINRILRPDGHLLLTTPNICSLRAAGALLLGYHPGLFHQYVRPNDDGDADPRHSREYAPRDIQAMFEAAGFAVERIETGPYLARHSAEFDWVRHLMRRYQLADHLRGDVIYAVGRKTGGVAKRYPSALYTEAVP
ncbi:MAG TPA: glycosyltransferase [Bryobacterales bacterium]|nr:glycosyltransferase [Bryobacterales bacterium]